MKQVLLADLTDRMQSVLILATNEGIRVGDEGVNPRTLNALEKRGLIHITRNRKGRALWRPTDRGRGVVAAHVPRLLTPAARPAGTVRGITHEPWRAMYGEPESMSESGSGSGPGRRRVVKDETLRESLAAMKQRNAERDS